VDASALRAFRAVQNTATGREHYAYITTRSGTDRALGEAEALEAAARRTLGDPQLTLTVLEPLIERPGPAAGDDTRYHYVVETDVEPQHERELNAWYDTEHLPGLAAVPGAARARRYRNLRHAPRYYACYDLVAPDVLERAEWLAVRGTEWSSRVRPTFRNPKRTMFEKT
jgi:hypothetical protein